MTKLWIGKRKHSEHLQRLAVVFAADPRLKIVTELYQREMSPKQFFDEFGGGSVSRIDKHFKRLASSDWLRPVRTEGPGGKRRGGIETIYRATELAYCDHETWAALPYSIRVAFTWNSYKEVAERVLEAMREGTFVLRPERHLTGTRLILDQLGSERVIAAITAEIAAQFEEQEDARRRADRSGEALFRAGSLLLAFELPRDDDPQYDRRIVPTPEPFVPFLVRLAKVFLDGVCMQIIDDANRGKISVPTFLAKYGERFELDESAVRRRFRKLVKAGWLKKVESKSGGKRRGAVEKFYRATGPYLACESENVPWADVPDSLADAEDWKTFERISGWAMRALKSGTFNRRDDMCLAWSILQLDQQGWENLTASLERLYAYVLKERAAAEDRLAESGDKPVVLVAALGAFETPKPVKEF